MKVLNIKELLVNSTFYSGEVEMCHTITYEDLTKQTLNVKDLTESDKHRISEFMKKAQIEVSIRRNHKSNITETIGRYFI